MAVTGKGDYPLNSSWGRGRGRGRGTSNLYTPVWYASSETAKKTIWLDWFFEASGGASNYTQGLSASVVTGATLSKQLSLLKTLSASVVTSATLTKLVSLYRTLSASVVTVATLSKGLIFLKELAVTVATTATLSTISAFRVALTSSVTTVASMSQTLFAVARDVVRMMMGIGR